MRFFELLLIVAYIVVVTYAQAPAPPAGYPGIPLNQFQPQLFPSMSQSWAGHGSSNHPIYFYGFVPNTGTACPKAYIGQDTTNGACQNTIFDTLVGSITYTAASQTLLMSLSSTTKAGWTATVTVQCSQGSSQSSFSSPNNQYVVTGSDPNLAFAFSFQSAGVCQSGGGGGGGASASKSGITGGGVFLIIFFVSATVYLAGGYLYNYRVKQQQGVEAIPNIEFWRDFPLLVRDGCVFTFTSVKGLFNRGGEGYKPV